MASIAVAQMAGSSEAAKVGKRRREARRRAALAEKGIRTLTLSAPEAGHPGLKSAAARMRNGEDPDAALRRAGGGNEAHEDERVAELEAQLAAAESDLSDAGELVDRLSRSVAGWRRRAETAESETRRVREMPGMLPAIARAILKISAK